MKLRIKDNSVRFRITLRELHELEQNRSLRASSVVPPMGDKYGVFSYSLTLAEDDRGSRLELEPFGMNFVLCKKDFLALLEPDREGVYIQHEWADPFGEVKRFMAFVEKDRPGSSCEKPEEWIYEEGRPGVPQVTRPAHPSR